MPARFEALFVASFAAVAALVAEPAGATPAWSASQVILLWRLATPIRSASSAAGRYSHRGVWCGASTPGAALAEPFQVDRTIDRSRQSPYLSGLVRPSASPLDVAPDRRRAWTTRSGDHFDMSTAPHAINQRWARATPAM